MSEHVVTHVAAMRARRLLLIMLVTAAMALGLGACTQIKGQINTQRAVERAGFTDVDVNTQSDNGFDTLFVKARTADAGNADDAAIDRAAQAAYLTFPLRFDELDVTIRGFDATRSKQYSEGQLRSQFPGRNPDFDRKTVSQDLEHLGIGLLIGIVVAGVLGIVAVVVVVVLVVRAGRRKRAAAQAWNPWGPGGGGMQPPPPPGGGWGQPPPPPPPGPVWGQPGSGPDDPGTS